MSGASIRIELDDRQAQAKLSRLLAAGENPTTLLKDIGEYLSLSTDQRFRRREAPDGSRWLPVSDKYAERKRAGKAGRRGLSGDRRPENLLRLTGQLQDLLRYQILGEELAFGTGPETGDYAAVHQFGSLARNIPARPFLGLSQTDEVEITDLVNRYLAAA